MPESQPLSVVEKYEDLREFLPDLEDIGAKHDELDLLNEVLGDQEYQAIGEVYDILTMQLPEAEEGSVNLLVGQILDSINTEYRPAKHAREMREILTSDHFKAFLEAYEDIVTKAYASDNDDSWDFGKPAVDIVETNIDTGKTSYSSRQDDEIRDNYKEERRENDRREDRRDRREDRQERKPRRIEEDNHKDEDRKRREIQKELEQKLGRKPRLAVEEDFNGDRSDDYDDRKNDKRKNDYNKDNNSRPENEDDYSDNDRRENNRKNKGREDNPKQDRKQVGYGSYDPPAPVFDQYKENQRFVLLRKTANEPLGITVRQDDNDNLFIAKIRQNSLADKQSRLQIGDIVKEVNGEAVFVPEDLMAILKNVEEWIIIKIVPTDITHYGSQVTFLRSFVSYNPMTDRLIPYKKVGLSYEKGDMLAVLDDSDENWWQARIIDGPDSPLGLIPSRSLQEKRQVFVNPETTKAKSSLLCGMGKKKKKVGYDAANASEYEDGHVKIYEEVELSDSYRCSLILIGADKEAKRHLKERIIREFPSKYATVVPETSRPMKPKDRQGRGFVFVDLQTMKDGIKRNLYMEEGEYNGNWYGLRTSCVHDVINTGKTCVLDVAPEYLKTLMCNEFRPVVVFIAAPRWESVKARRGYRKGRRINNNMDEDGDDDELEERCKELERESQAIKERYRRNFDEVIINDDLENTYQNLVAFIDSVKSAKKWVPKNWGKTI